MCRVVHKPVSDIFDAKVPDKSNLQVPPLCVLLLSWEQIRKLA